MAPKPRPVQRRLSSAAKDGTNQLQKTPNPQAMPPPPVPASVPAAPPLPKGILVPEAAALSGCLRSAVVKTGQVVQFYADSSKLGLRRYAPYPPRTLTSSLGREVEKYGQLCDAIQSQLHRAITVLQRDLKREQDRIKAAEAEAAARAAAAAAPPPQEAPSISPTQENESTTASPTTQTQKTLGLTARRQSTISLSSLQRPPFPHKLDLSAATLRLDPNDPSLQPGMSSPVTLAPKSSISKVPPDFTFGPPQDVDIDLTLGDDVVPTAGVVETTLGSSADKPIELDLDLDMDIDLFGDATGDLGATGSNITLSGADVAPKQEQLDLDIFSGLPESPDGDSAKADAELLAAAQAIPPHESGPSTDASHPGLQQQSQGSDASALTQPSPSMLEAISAAAADMGESGTDGGVAPSGSESFDFGNFDFLGDGPVDTSDMDMQDLFDINTTDPRPPQAS